MYRILLLSFVSVSVWAVTIEDMPKCKSFLKPGGLSCCKKSYNLFHNLKEKEECLKLPMAPPSCEAQICFAKKAGFALDDGKVDRAALTNMLEKAFENDQDFLNKIKDNCIDGDMDTYGPPEFCEIIKMKACIDVIVMKECPEWDSSDQCSGAEEAAKECIKIFT